MPDFGDSVDSVGTGEGRYGYQGSVSPNDYRMTPAELAVYQAKRRRDALLGVLGVLGATTGMSAVGGMLGGGAAGAAGAAGSASVPGAVGASAPALGMGSVTAGAAGLPSGIGAASAAGGIGAGAAGAVGAGTGAGAIGGGAGAGAGAAGAGFLGMSAKDLAALGVGLGGVIGGAMSNPPNMAPNTSTTDPQLQELIALMSGRLRKSEPLFDSVQAMANGLLPTQYQKGGGGMG